MKNAKGIDTKYLILLFLISFSTCTERKAIQEELLLSEYENIDQFKYWSAYPRDKGITIFDFQKDTVLTGDRYLVMRKGKDFLVFNAGFGENPRSKEYKKYANLDNALKEAIPFSVIKDYYFLGFEKISYVENGKNSYQIFSNDQETYLYFFHLDSLKPPKAIYNFEKISDRLYYRGKDS